MLEGAALSRVQFENSTEKTSNDGRNVMLYNSAIKRSLLHVLPGAFMLVQRPFGQFGPFPNPTSTKALALTAQPHPGYM